MCLSQTNESLKLRQKNEKLSKACCRDQYSTVVAWLNVLQSKNHTNKLNMNKYGFLLLSPKQRTWRSDNSVDTELVSLVWIHLYNWFLWLSVCLPGSSGLPERQYSSFNSAVSFLKFFYLSVISNRFVKFNLKMKFNIFQVCCFCWLIESCLDYTSFSLFQWWCFIQ